MPETQPQSHPEIREAVRRLCAGFPGEYWQARDRDRIYPDRVRPHADRGGFPARS